jgi:hypothetical protein
VEPELDMPLPMEPELDMPLPEETELDMPLPEEPELDMPLPEEPDSVEVASQTTLRVAQPTPRAYAPIFNRTVLPPLYASVWQSD